MTNVAVLGAGAIGMGYAAYLAQKGHAVSLWSPSGKGIAALVANNGQLWAEGVVNGEFKVLPCRLLDEAIRDAEVVVFALPANAHESVMRAAAAFIRPGQLLVVTPVLSLSALFIAEQLTARGVPVRLCASPTTMLTARRLSGTLVRIMTIRGEVDLSTWPPEDSTQAMQTMEGLFGGMFVAQANLLASSLANVNPVAHVPLALMNITRMERGERWLQYEQFTGTVSRMIKALDEERVSLGVALGLSLRPIEDHFCRSFGATPGTLVDIAAQIAEMRNGGPEGPCTLNSRYLAEDVPFGLVFYSRIGQLVGVPTPNIDSCITLASTAMGTDYRSQNGLPDALELSRRTVADLLTAVTRPLEQSGTPVGAES